MKKFIAMLLVLFIGLTFAGCESNKNALAYNIENNINKLSTLLEKTKEITDEDIIMKELKSNGNYTSKTTTQKSTENKVDNTKQISNKNVINDKNLTNVDTTKKVMPISQTNNSKKIENLPKPIANTQIVKNSDKTVSVAAKDSTNDEIDIDELIKTKDKRTFSTRSGFTLVNPKVSKQASRYNRAEIEKMANRAVTNAIPRVTNDMPFKRITTGQYIPRRMSTAEYDNSGLTNYFSKIEDLYLMMNDACTANKDCGCLKSCILQNCDMLNLLCKQLKNNEIELSNEQIQACNDCLNSLNQYTNTLNNTKNDVQTQCNAVKTMNINPNANIEQVSSKYVKLINCLDDRLTCYANILSILTQLRCTITGVCGEENVEEALKIEENLEENKQEPLPEVTLKEEPKIEDNMENKQEEKLENNQEENVENEQKTEIQNNDKIDENTPQTQENNNKVSIVKKENVKKLSDYNDKNLNVSNLPKHNLDTYKNQTINPNVGTGLNNKNNKTDTKTNDNETKNDENEANKDNAQTDRVNQSNNLPNNTNTMNNGTFNNGVNNGVGVNNGFGVNNGVGINGYPNGNGFGYNNNVISNGYGYHNYENGVTNPYRNTDTYKLPNGNGINNGIYGGGVVTNNFAKFQPLESETRKDFKPFKKIA